MALSSGDILRGDRYQIRKLLARGGFGFIYLAFDWLTRRQVVLKELIPALVGDAEVLRRFVREGRAMQRLSHPNIVRAEASFKDHGNRYLVLEYLSGGSLADWTDRGRKMPLAQAARVAVALSDALTYLHTRGITHCDINPSNILFDIRGQPKLIDLGIAHVSDAFVHRSWQTQHEFAIGTVLYMAPEQLEGVRSDRRVDLYALGALLYQLLAGRHYLDFDLRPTASAQIHNVNLVRTQMPEPIANVPPEVNQVLMRALVKDPYKRYPNVATFRSALVHAVLPYVSPRDGIALASPFGVEGEEGIRRREGGDLPRWVWGTLVVMNVLVMLVVAVLLLASL
jgi:serine/threonine protein kinase